MRKSGSAEATCGLIEHRHEFHYSDHESKKLGITEKAPKSAEGNAEKLIFLCLV